MGIFATLLPGVRQLRTPLAIGGLWLTLIILAASPDGNPLSAVPDDLDPTITIFRKLPESYLGVGLLFGSYIIGSVLSGLSEGFLVHFSSKALRLTNWITGKLGELFNGEHWGNQSFLGKYWNIWPSLDHDMTDVASFRGPILDSVSEAYAGLEAPTGASLAFPIEGLIDRLDITALQVWSTEPLQYQEYDRLGAEADFRAGIGLPLTALGVLFAIRLHWLAFPIFLLAAITLARHSLSLRRQQNVLMANALYIGTAKSPLLSGVITSLENRLALGDLRPQDSWGKWWGATAVALTERSEFDLSNSVVHEILSIDEARSLLDSREYLQTHDRDSYDLLKRLSGKRT